MSVVHLVPRIRGGSDRDRMPSFRSRLCVECLLVWGLVPLFWFLVSLFIFWVLP